MTMSEDSINEARECKKTGTKEWAETNYNFQLGCENNCRYCYAKRMAERFAKKKDGTVTGRMPVPGWEYPKMRDPFPEMPHGKTRVMFPSVHDITPANILTAINVIDYLVDHNAEILIVTKPNLDCIRQLIAFLDVPEEKKRIEFRCTIGTVWETVRKGWEPGAPSIDDRLEAVQLLMNAGFTVSISCEPLLDPGCEIIEALLRPKMRPELLKEIWIGAMNYVKGAPKLDYKGIYERYKLNPRIKWKESFRKHLEPPKKRD